jgi:hypothetical protein
VGRSDDALLCRAIASLLEHDQPASGVDGIRFVSGGSAINIVSDTTPFSIFVTGAGADGIYTRGTGPGATDINIDHTGNEGRFSDLVEQHAGGIKASLPF